MERTRGKHKLIRKQQSPISKIALALLCLAPAVLFILSWQAYVTYDPSHKFIFSSPDLVWQAFVTLLLSGELLRNSAVTLGEALAGFVLGTVSGAIIGLALWYVPLVARVSRPYIAALGAIPIFALAPVIIVWFGIGTISKIVLAFISTVVIAIFQSYQGATSVEPKYLRLMQVVGASRFQVFRTVVLPSSIIWVMNAIKLNISMALLGAFIGEFISSEQGLGHMIVRASGTYDMATVYVGVAALIVIALTLTAAVELLERRLLRWREVT